MALRARDARKSQYEVYFIPPDESNGPHKTLTPCGESEPVPYASRKYDWVPEQPGAARELEDHIRKLQVKRRQASDEAEAVWQWLSERELEYYRLKAKAKAGSDVRGLTTMKRYLETVSRRQNLLWLEVSIGQLRMLKTN